ncbi:MAG: methyltransferase [Idiomarina sp.]
MGFQCKQFYLKDDQCAMKVGTDSLLLGAWVNAGALQRANRVLDIGCGCGVLALMLAQRTAGAESPVHIDAVELDSAAAGQAQENADASAWSDRIGVVNDDVLHWRRWSAPGSYDVLISNPPYFAGDFPSPNRQRELARHQRSLTLANLVTAAAALAAPNAVFALVLPASCQQQLLALMQAKGFALQRLCLVKPVPDAAAKLMLCEFVFTEQQVTSVHQELTIATGETTANGIKKSAGAHYTSAFKALTCDFYLGRGW